VRLTRLHLRNYRVYEEPLDLEIPPGLVGVYGVNGAGKSTLLEAIVFSLWGKARTGKEDVRTSGVGGDCVAEVEFEHEGHLYLVRRTLTGINSTAKAEAHCDRLLMAEGVRDTGRYVHQVLGMDDTAFRASVFAEQKQLAAFSSQTPTERRRLILQLLGITPLDSARDAARKDARERREQHERLRSLLPDVDLLRVEADDAAARAGALMTEAESEETVAAAARARAEAAEAARAELDRVRQSYDSLVLEGRAARSEHRAATVARDELLAERDQLSGAASRLPELTPVAEGLAGTEVVLSLVSAVVDASERAAALAMGAEPPAADQAALDRAQATAESAREALAGLNGRLQAGRAELGRARTQAEQSDGLSGQADCPLCGQSLGDAFEQVQAHRATEVTEAEARVAQIEDEQRRASATAKAAAKALEQVAAECTRRQQARNVYDQALARHRDAHAALATARGALVAHVAPAPTARGRATPAADRGGILSPGHAHAGLAGLDDVALADAKVRLDADVAAGRAASAEVSRLRGKLERQPVLADLIDRAHQRVADTEHAVGTLLDKVKALAFDPARLVAAVHEHDALLTAATRAAQEAQTARLAAERERARAEAAATRLADGAAQHAQLADLAAEASHLSRAAELINAFRNTVVATVGPRLAVQAAELFAELTDGEYDALEVDPETYELQVRDGGRLFGVDRLSGSEVDLANLALRVAISEHVRFQSGGSVGLMVLDEVFGPLDDDRKARMLLALERLRGRFRQILVVTHDQAIKEQLPNAIEVVKQPGRRATARLLHA